MMALGARRTLCTLSCPWLVPGSTQLRATLSRQERGGREGVEGGESVSRVREGEWVIRKHAAHCSGINTQECDTVISADLGPILPRRHFKGQRP